MSHCTRFALAALIVLCSVSVGHSIPQLINYQGILLDSNGDPVTTTTSVLFAIWDDPTMGDSLWSETQSVTPDDDGRFNVLLGAVSSIPDTALDVSTAYLSMKVDTDAELSPRTQLVSVAYAYRPGTVDGATGGIISGDVSIQSDLSVSGKATIGPGHTNTGTSAFVAGKNNTASGGNASVGGGVDNTASGTSSSVGGGTLNTASGGSASVGGGVDNTASELFSTVGGGQFNTASERSSTVGGGSSNIASALYSTVPGGRNNTAGGQYSFAAGRRAKANHDGSFVWADQTNADFSSANTNEFRIRSTNGIYQKADNTSYGSRFDNDGDGDGIRTYSSVSKGNGWAALYAINTGTSPAIYGNSTGGDAGYFAGNVTVTGTLTKGAGAFKIDHPLDPANKYLVHSFVESPDMMNVYNGNTVLDASGAAVVALPDYFEVLNRDFRYQLTAIGVPGPNLYIAEKISGNQFSIAGGDPGTEVSWQVTGVRQDAFANAHRIQVEVDKPTTEVGKYLHPLEHGKPLSLSVNNSNKLEELQ